MDKEINRLIHASVDRSNQAARILQNRRSPKTGRRIYTAKRGVTYCNKTFLQDQLTGRLARTLIGQMETFAEGSEHIERRRIAFRDSIYRDFIVEETPTISASERVSSVINVAGHYIGTDKLGHFFTEGKSYFDIAIAKGEGVERALLFGVFTESLYYGALTTGVFSYADLTANFNGFQFWRRVVGKGSDNYIVCDGNKWIVNKPFEIALYVDEAWDESVNCSLFRNEILLTKVALRLKGRSCGASEDVYSNLSVKYQNLYSQLVNDRGHGILPKSLEPDFMLVKYLHDDSTGEWLQETIKRSQGWFRQWEENNTINR